MLKLLTATQEEGRYDSQSTLKNARLREKCMNDQKAEILHLPPSHSLLQAVPHIRDLSHKIHGGSFQSIHPIGQPRAATTVTSLDEGFQDKGGRSPQGRSPS
jgi:hypothetical protein